MAQQQLMRVRERPRYLEIRNWERFQHYKDRKPIWIKFYVELLDDTDLRRLPYATRLLWDQLMLLAARLDNRIPNDLDELAMLTRIDRQSVEEGVQHLLQGAWIKERRASKPASRSLADPEQPASPHARPRARGEAEKEKETPYPLSERTTTGPPNGTVAQAEAFIRNGGYDLTDLSLEAEFDQRGIPEDQRHPLRDLAADLRRPGAA